MNITEIDIGYKLPSFSSKTSVKSIQMGAITSRDWQPLHRDQIWSKEEAKLPDIIMNNYTYSGWLSRYITDWAGPSSRIGELDFKMITPIVPNDLMIFEGEISKITKFNENITWFFIDISVLVQGKKVTDSKAKVAIPHDENPINSPWKLRKEDWKP
jgi:acyl dehydratase|tara:strand:+ start:1708 stop:2178 length:471 start_codon:yes stop_codon:yes gene_type:complete